LINTVLFNKIYTFLFKDLANQYVTEKRLGQVRDYSNTNFTILQAVINCVYFNYVASKSKTMFNPSRGYYTLFVSNETLGGMGIDLNTKVFSPVADPVESQAHSYGDLYFKQKGAVAAAGWVPTMRE